MLGFLRGLAERWRIRVITFVKWILFACLTGGIIGVVGGLFHEAVNVATVYREAHDKLIWALPLTGLFITWLYHVSGMDKDPGTNYVLVAVRENAPLRLRMAPLIIAATVLTHLFGGSSGREGAALQMGSAISDSLGRAMRLQARDERMMMMCGMAAGFSALFGTPLTAAIFAMEVCSVGVMHYGAMFPCTLSSLVAALVAHAIGGEATAFTLTAVPALGWLTLVQVTIFGLLCAAVAILVCTAFGVTHRFFLRHIPKPYLRVFLGGCAVVGLTLLCRTHDYNGAGMNIISAAIEQGAAHPEAFALKILFTAITLGCGFKGGEIVPAFFVGATFGAFYGALLGIPAGFAGALGMTAVFCGVTNCPLASILLAYELFGGRGLPLFTLCIAVSYMLSGYRGLYSEQKIMYSKYNMDEINRRAGD